MATLNLQWKILLMAVLFVAAAGCGNFGRVERGRVIAYDAAKGEVTLIADSNHQNPSNPRFDVLPPRVVKVPVDPKEMGPAPEPGKLTGIDLANHQLVFFDDSSRAFKTILYVPVEQHENVGPDDSRVARKSFPVVDREQKRITVYCAVSRKLVTLQADDQFLRLPEDTWKVGDDVLYYYKNPNQALRMMNVTKTDIAKKG
jgi:hypothetical protein